METSYASNCVLCPDSALDPLGHHAATCKRGGDAVLRHNKLRDILVVRPTFMFKLRLVLVLATIIPILGLQTS